MVFDPCFWPNGQEGILPHYIVRDYIMGTGPQNGLESNWKPIWSLLDHLIQFKALSDKKHESPGQL